MAETTNRSPRWQLPLLYVAQAQKEITHNEALTLLDGLVHSSAQDVANDPPASPQVGQCWIIGGSPTGDWAGKATMLALWSDGGWRFLAPKLGMETYIETTKKRSFYDGQQWQTSQAIAETSGGAVVDSKARETIANILAALKRAGIA